MMVVFLVWDVLACDCVLWKEGAVLPWRLRVSHWEARGELGPRSHSVGFLVVPS